MKTQKTSNFKVGDYVILRSKNRPKGQIIYASNDERELYLVRFDENEFTSYTHMKFTKLEMENGLLMDVERNRKNKITNFLKDG
jgi:hypothetical protein